MTPKDVLLEFIHDVEAAGVLCTMRSWPDLFLTYKHACSALDRPELRPDEEYPYPPKRILHGWCVVHQTETPCPHCHAERKEG